MIKVKYGIMDKVSLCAANLGGLGNRLKCLWSAQRIDKNAVIVWNRERVGISDMDGKPVDICPYAKLFQKDISVEIDNYERYLLDGWRLYVSGLCEKSVDFWFTGTPKSVVDAYLPIVQELKVANGIQQIIDQYDVSGLNGIHARTYPDYEPRANDWRKMIAQIDQFKPAFLCTDSKDLRAYYRGDPDILMTELDEEKLVVADWEMALVEMMLLAKTQRMLLTKTSTYSECAWWFSGCNPNVELLRTAIL